MGPATKIRRLAKFLGIETFLPYGRRKLSLYILASDEITRARLDEATEFWQSI
jgi:hypothetical protein